MASFRLKTTTTSMTLASAQSLVQVVQIVTIFPSNVATQCKAQLTCSLWLLIIKCKAGNVASVGWQVNPCDHSGRFNLNMPFIHADGNR